jgi:hypothetical protein
LREIDVHAHRPSLDEGDAVRDLGDHAAQTERSRAHGIAHLERAGLADGRIKHLVDGTGGGAGVLVGGAEPAVALGLGRASSLAGRLAPQALLAACAAQLLSQRLELAAVGREVALGLAPRALALVGDGGCGRLGRDPLSLLVAGCLLAQRCRLGSLALGLGAKAHRGLLGASGLAKQSLGLDALRREAIAGAPDDARVEAEPAGDLECV